MLSDAEGIVLVLAAIIATLMLLAAVIGALVAVLYGRDMAKEHREGLWKTVGLAVVVMLVSGYIAYSLMLKAGVPQ